MTACRKQHVLSLFWQGVLCVLFLSAPPSNADFDALDINEGELHFLTALPADPPHHHTMTVNITPDSLKHGWVEATQCHYQLDKVSAMQVVFGAGRVRKLQILRSDNIQRTWIENDSVQLEEIGDDAVLCIVSENRALDIDAANGEYHWHGGPYMRRFLDGFFPMRVTLVMNYPMQLLKLQKIEPRVLKLKAVTVPGQVRIDTLFEGRLVIGLQFHGPKTGSGIGWE